MNKLALSVVVLSLGAGCGSAEAEAGGAGGAGGNSGGGAGYESPESELPADAAEADLVASQTKTPVTPGNCLAAAPLEAVSLALLDTQGMASVGRAREALQREPAEIPWPSRIRTNDFVNYYRFSVPKPADAQGEAFVTAQAKYRLLYNDANPSGVFTGQWDVVIALQALPPKNRAKHAFVVLLDTTPSMAGVGLGRAKAVLGALLKNAPDGDHVVVLTSDPEQAPVIEVDLTGPAERDQALAAVGALDLGAEAPITDAIDRAYELAEYKQGLGVPARVVLVSDGGGDVTRLNETRIAEGAAPGASPILLTAVGTGSSNTFRSTLLRRASELGRGPYVYVDSEDEADRLFGQRLAELTELALDDVSLDLEASSFFTVQQGGDAEPASESPRPQYLAPGGSLTKLIRLVPCKFAGWPDDAALKVTAKFSGQTATWSGNLHELKKLPHELVDKALAVDAFADALRARDADRLGAAKALLETTLKAGADPQLAEIQGLLGRHPMTP
ncbi:MAG: VWA domain-containing protein [Polyangiaceae bacterium]|nr:VWA domain-containing protein [Polyangiaceae bacterium]